MADLPRSRCGIVGAGRTRNGLGPFLATHLEAAGGEVVGISGRHRDRTAATARQLQERLGHPVRAHDSVEQFVAAEELDALIVAAPVEAHLPALRAGLKAGLPVLCEKPLVRPDQTGEVAALVRAYTERGLPLMENCQWPEVLPAYAELYPGAVGASPQRFAMRLSPSGCGPMMLEDSLSHFLSMVQALAAVDARTRIVDLAFTGTCGPEDGLTVTLALEGPLASVACHLELRQCATQPRPAWFAVDGQRADREIDVSDYSIRLCAGGRNIRTGDPTAALVYRFLRSIRNADTDEADEADEAGETSSERNRIESARIEQRARLYAEICGALGPHLGGSA